MAQEAKALETATGYKINWKQFGGGGEVIKAMASCAVQVGEVGSAGISAAVSRGEPLELFWIIDDIGDAEALVAKKGSGTNTVRLSTFLSLFGRFYFHRWHHHWCELGGDISRSRPIKAWVRRIASLHHARVNTASTADTLARGGSRQCEQEEPRSQSRPRWGEMPRTGAALIV